MRTLNEKIKIIKEYQTTEISLRKIAKKYNTSTSVIAKWTRKYENQGKTELKSNTGKFVRGKGNFKRREIEQLKEELLKKEIEIMRLKKGYMVKVVGAKKEYVSISDLNMKS